MFERIKRLYNQLQKLYQIKKQIDLIDLEITRHESIEELYPEFEKLKQIIFDCGSLYVKFLQWYISKLKSNIINDDTLESRNTYKFIKYFEDIFENCPFHNLDHTKEIFKNSMLGYDLENYIDITTLKEIASGSIGQVYYARRKSDDLEIAIKIKHPDIANDLENQLEVIRLLKFLQSFTYFRKRYNLIFNIDDFLTDLTQQCDFRIEAQNNLQFRKNFESSKHCIIFPEIIFYSEDILISHYISGECINTLSETQQYLITINFLCFFYQMFLIDNFIHGDLHCKNWKVKLTTNGKHQLIVYDCGICFKNINTDISNDFWFSLSKYDLPKLIKTMQQLICTNDNNNISYDDLSNGITVLFNDIMKDSVSTTLFLKSLLNFFSSRNIIVNKFLLNFTILLCVIEEVLKKGNIINRDKSMMISMFDLMTDNQLDIISFCQVNKCYPKVAELFEYELNNKYIEYRHNIAINKITENNNTTLEPELFSSIVLSGLTFTNPE